MISFIIYYLAYNLDAKKKMLEDIDPITENDFNNLKYFEAII